MKIANSAIQQAYQNTGIRSAKKQPAEVVKAPEKQSMDSVVLSSATKDLQKVSANMDTQPKQRTEKIAELKSIIDQGNYTVDPEKVAEKMVGTFLNITS